MGSNNETRLYNMGFLSKINKASRFLNKGLNTAEHFGQKIVKGANKGLHIGDKILNIADKTLGALESVPVVGEVVAPGRALLKQGHNLLNVGESGLSKADKLMNSARGKRLRIL